MERKVISWKPHFLIFFFLQNSHFFLLRRLLTFGVGLNYFSRGFLRGQDLGGPGCSLSIVWSWVKKILAWYSQFCVSPHLPEKGKQSLRFACKRGFLFQHFAFVLYPALEHMGQGALSTSLSPDSQAHQWPREQDIIKTEFFCTLESNRWHKYVYIYMYFINIYIYKI